MYKLNGEVELPDLVCRPPLQATTRMGAGRPNSPLARAEEIPYVGAFTLGAQKGLMVENREIGMIKIELK
jgi:hypothetical protein